MTAEWEVCFQVWVHPVPPLQSLTNARNVFWNDTVLHGACSTLPSQLLHICMNAAALHSFVGFDAFCPFLATVQDVSGHHHLSTLTCMHNSFSVADWVVGGLGVQLRANILQGQSCKPFCFVTNVIK